MCLLAGRKYAWGHRPIGHVGAGLDLYMGHAWSPMQAPSFAYCLLPILPIAYCILPIAYFLYCL